jgi:hypothetical protein
MITILETNAGRRPADGDKASNEIPVFIRADAGEQEEEVLAALRGWVPATFAGLKLSQCAVSQRLDDGLYLGTASYAPPDKQKDTNESTFSFDTSGAKFKITQAIAQTKYPTTAADAHGVIGASSEKVEGVEIDIPQYAFKEVHYLPDSMVTLTYRGLIYRLTGRVCNAPFKGCEAGEGLFLGASGQKRGRGDWEITFGFAASPNVTGLTIGTITGINKKGWEYLWTRYQTKAIGTGADKILTEQQA